MGIGPAIFESAGQRSEHYIPGAYSRSNSVGGGSGGVSAGNGVILGKSTGGKPQALLEFATIAEAKDALVSGELLDAVAHAFTPGGDYAPQKVLAMRVNPGTQAGRTLKNGAAGILAIKSWDYGVHTNQLKMKILSGTNTYTKKVTANYKGNETITDNIGLDSFTLQYTGAGSAATAAITATGIAVVVTGADDGISINFADVETIEGLVARFNDNPSYVAILQDSTPNALTADLDAASGISLSAAATFRSNLYALIQALKNNPYVGFVALVSGAERLIPDNDTGYVYFEGGTVGSYTVSEWNDALQALETEDIQIVSTPSTDVAVATLIGNHCISMSNVTNRKERTALLGGPIGESVDEAVVKAKTFGSKYISYCYPAIIASNPITGDTETLAASYFACKLLGMESCVSVNEPLTWKTVKVLSFYKNLRTGDKEKLIKAGVLCGGTTDDNRLAVIRAMTTYQGSTLQDVERSMVREDLYMNRDLRQRYSQGVGKPSISKGGEEESTFKQAVAEWAGMGLVQSNDSGEFYWGLKITVKGDKKYITFSRYLTAPQNFFFITANNYVYGESTTVSV